MVIPESTEYCITGLYNQDTFFLIIPTLLDIMFYETVYYKDEEIFFNFTKKDTDISIKRRSLDLIYLIINSSNIKHIIKECLNFLLVAENEFKYELTTKVNIFEIKY